MRLLLGAFFLAVAIQANCVNEKTHNRANVYHRLNVPLGVSKAVTFTVAAKNDAHIGFFTSSAMSKNPMYEIVLSGWGNTQSVLRRSNQGRNLVTKATRGMLNRGRNTQFWADAKNGLLRVGTGKTIGQNTLMQWKDPNPLNVNTVGVMTGWGSDAQWTVCAAVRSSAAVKQDLNKAEAAKNTHHAGYAAAKAAAAQHIATAKSHQAKSDAAAAKAAAAKAAAAASQAAASKAAAAAAKSKAAHAMHAKVAADYSKKAAQSSQAAKENSQKTQLARAQAAAHSKVAGTHTTIHKDQSAKAASQLKEYHADVAKTNHFKQQAAADSKKAAEHSSNRQKHLAEEQRQQAIADNHRSLAAAALAKAKAALAQAKKYEGEEAGNVAQQTKAANTAAGHNSVKVTNEQTAAKASAAADAATKAAIAATTQALQHGLTAGKHAKTSLQHSASASKATVAARAAAAKKAAADAATLAAAGPKCAREHAPNGGNVCKCYGVVTYGAVSGSKGGFAVKKVKGQITCNNANFGDPVHGVVKDCYCKPVKTDCFKRNQANCAPAGSRCTFDQFDSKCVANCEHEAQHTCSSLVGCQWQDMEGFGWCEADPNHKKKEAPHFAVVDNTGSQNENKAAEDKLKTMCPSIKRQNFCAESKSLKVRTCNLNSGDVETVVCQLSAHTVKALDTACVAHNVMDWTCF